MLVNKVMPTNDAAGVGLPRPRAQSRLRSSRTRVLLSIAERGDLGFAWVLGFVLVHMALALLMNRVHQVAGIHALGTFVVGLWLCFERPRPSQVAQWIGYVVGAEVLWRMCKAPIPWEFAKYAICFVCVVSLLRSGAIRRSLLPLLYFGLLIPAAFITFALLPLNEARQQVSFNLSGPLCLALCALWFQILQLTKTGFQRVGVMLLGPIAGVAFIALFGLATTEVDFTSESNLATSGGYGPNQVSAMFGLGALLAVFLYLGEKRSHLLRGALALSALWLLAQSALTFSRTGLYLFGATFGVAAIFLVQWKGGGRRFVFLSLVLGTAVCIVLPMLDAFTGGKLGERFRYTGLTGRDSIAKMDLQIWRERPVFGAGAGMSEYLRAALGDEHAAHTEYTRLMAEHGLLGAISLCVLLLMTGQAFLRAQGPWAKAIVSALAVWAFLFMAVTAMRLAAPAFLLGLIHARFLIEPGTQPTIARAGSISRRHGLRNMKRKNS
jgi:hypothetical protein